MHSIVHDNIAHSEEHPSKLRTLLYMIEYISVYLRYNVIGVIYMYIYDNVFDMEL